ncbi:MAG: MBL fold metallo-hydrolase [Gaiellales bacterium]
MSADEISAAELEDEIVRRAAVAILDVRPAADVTQWRIDPNGRPFLNLPESEISADPAAAVSAIRAMGQNGGELRTLCNRGVASMRAASALSEAGLSVASVAGGMIAWSRLLVPAPVDIGTDTAVAQFRREARGCLSYLVASEGEALVVDPGPDVHAYVEEASRLGARVTHVLDTHVHADHLSGGRSLADQTGATLHLSAKSLARGLQYAARVSAVSDRDRIPVGSAQIEVVDLPGHTTDNIGVLVDGRALIAGDSLFADSVARPDLEAGDEGAADAARILHGTLSERILGLPGDTLLLPCHYPGGRLGGSLAPPIGDVAAKVDFLALDEDEFATEVVADMPPRPANYLNIIAVNLGAESGADVAGLEVGANSCAAR